MGPPIEPMGGRRGEACVATRWANLCKLSCQKAAGRGRPTGSVGPGRQRLASRPSRREASSRSKDRPAGLRIAGLGRETVTVGPRGKGGQRQAECQALGLRCTPRRKSQRNRRFRPVDGRARPPGRAAWRYLVDPASSHMLVSKIKPCMSKYKLLYTVKLRMAH